MIRLYMLAAAALLASPAVAYAEDCNALPGVPVTISVPGKYCLASDYTINSTTARAITIASNDVTLDCRGHTLKNASTNNAGTSVGISLNSRSNVVIKNCRVLGGFQIGIDATQAQNLPNKNFNLLIQDNLITGAFWNGIRVQGSGIEISGNRLTDIGGQLNQYSIGIRVAGSTAASQTKVHIVRGNTVGNVYSPYSAAYAIFSDGSNESLFLDNTIVRTWAVAGKNVWGMYVIGQLNRMSDNHITGLGAPTEGAIFGSDYTSSCFDNYLRTTTWTQGCDAAYGNY